MCGASIPELLRDRLHAIADSEDGFDPQEVFWTGVSYAAYQCRTLLERPNNSPFGVPYGRGPGVAGIHFYTLNRSPATRALFEILQLSRAVH